MTTAQPAVLLEHYLKQLKLPTVLRELLDLALPFYAHFAAAAGLDPQVRHEATRAL